MKQIEKYEKNLISQLKNGNIYLDMDIDQIIKNGLTKDNLENLQKTLYNLDQNAFRLKICLEIKDFNNKKGKENGK